LKEPSSIPLTKKFLSAVGFNDLNNAWTQSFD